MVTSVTTLMEFHYSKFEFCYTLILVWLQSLILLLFLYSAVFFLSTNGLAGCYALVQTAKKAIGILRSNEYSYDTVVLFYFFKNF
jgi:hypothetical protein